MTENKLYNSNLKTIVTILLFTFLGTTIVFAITIKKNSQDNLEANNKINSLINEVGDLKEMNNNLFNEYLREKQQLKIIQDNLQKIDSAINEKLAEKETALTKINSINKQLLQELQSKELSIAELAQKNKALKEEAENIKYSPDIDDIAIIGQNEGLTDTIMIVSINPLTKKIAVVSIPRDLYQNGRKINEIYKMYGINKLKDTLTDITGINIDKYIIVDFKAFVALIDNLGGIDIDVKKSFTDNQYPDPNGKFVEISFTAGQQHMDGITALKYVRSRKSTSDFDRSERQQQVLQSLRQKITALDLVGNFNTILSIYNNIKDNITTDLNLFEILALYDTSKNYDIKINNVISNRNFLYTSVNSAGQYILLPINGNYAKIKKYISNLVNS